MTTTATDIKNAQFIADKKKIKNDRHNLLKLICKCVDLENASTSQKKLYDKKISDFDRYLTRLKNYIDFKEANPNSGNNPDLFAYVTPLTKITQPEGKVQVYHPEVYNSSTKILKKFQKEPKRKSLLVVKKT